MAHPLHGGSFAVPPAAGALDSSSTAEQVLDTESVLSRESKRSGSLLSGDFFSMEDMKRRYLELKRRLKQTEDRADTLDRERKNLIKNMHSSTNKNGANRGEEEEDLHRPHEGGKKSKGSAAGGRGAQRSGRGKNKKGLDVEHAADGELQDESSVGTEDEFLKVLSERSLRKQWRLQKQRRFLVITLAFAMMLCLAPLSIFLLNDRLKP